MRLVACDLCGSSEAAVLFTQRDPRPSDAVRSFRVVECRRCGLIYLNPRPEGPDLAAYFPQDYPSDPGCAAGSRGPGASLSRRLRTSVRRSLLEQCYHYPTRGDSSPARANGLLSLTRRTCLRIERSRLRVIGREAAIIPFVGRGRLLDVGCGTGGGLASLREQGWDVTGIELNSAAALLARQRVDGRIHIGDFEEVSLAGECFDVIRFCHSLEHLPSPRRALEKAHRLLQPGGLLWIEVPNAASLERRIFGRHWFAWGLPEHLYHFTPRTLARLLACTSFRPVKFGGDGRGLVFAESVAGILAGRLGVRPQRSKLISAMVRPLTLALAAVNRAAILFVHAQKDQGLHPADGRGPS